MHTAGAFARPAVRPLAEPCAPTVRAHVRPAAAGRRIMRPCCEARSGPAEGSAPPPPPSPVTDEMARHAQISRNRYLRERSEAGDTGTALFWTAVGFAYRHHLLRLLEPAAELASGGGSGIGGGSGQGGWWDRFGWGAGGGGSGAAGSLHSDGAERKRKPKPVTLTLVSFAVSRKAYGRITKRFIKEYKEKTGVDVGFRLSFGASGTQARAIIDGLPGDIAALSLPLDIMKIADAGLMRKDWRKAAPNNAVLSTSVVAIVVRTGNPKDIRGWNDLTRDDVSTITANPKTAGVARWNFLALWGAHMADGERAAYNFVKKVFQHVPIQPRDAREASDVFYKQKNGDALLTYENEVVMTNLSVAPQSRLPYVVPGNNVTIEFPIALVDRNLDEKGPEARAAAQAFMEYCFTPESQREFAECGFRSINKEVAKDYPMPPVKTEWSVEKMLGGWHAAQTKFFDEAAVLDKIQNEVGRLKMDQRQADQKAASWFNWGRKDVKETPSDPIEASQPAVAQ
mmetsp:Transcript_17073/g.51010  ORF Transcript_17073/g.51010 Transcript_17073/m.51010 type:complete len:512 (-) Transcript_17073:211-1746(-)